MGKPEIKIVGLGPGDDKLLLSASKVILDEAVADNVLLLRTAKHPAAGKYVDQGALTLDFIYEQNFDRQIVYKKLADFVFNFALDNSRAVYAVPGSPAVGEDSVSNLLKRQNEIDIELIGGISFLDLVFTKLKFDPIASSISIVDGEQFGKFGMDKSGPLLITQTYNSEILSKIKLAISDAYDLLGIEDLVAMVLFHLGIEDEAVFEVRLDKLDRDSLSDEAGKFSVVADHLTSIFINLPASPSKLLIDLKDTVYELRQKCPWDKKQTFGSLAKNIVEECYELVDAANSLSESQDYDNLIEELGDLLFFVLIYGQIGQETGSFNFNDILSELNSKLILRHPHVFKESKEVELNQFLRNWEVDKTKEKNRSSIFDGIPSSLPALSLLSKVLKKGSAANIDLVKLVEIPDLTEIQKTVLDLATKDVDMESEIRELAKKLILRGTLLENQDSP